MWRVCLWLHGNDKHQVHHGRLQQEPPAGGWPHLCWYVQRLPSHIIPVLDSHYLVQRVPNALALYLKLLNLHDLMRYNIVWIVDDVHRDNLVTFEKDSPFFFMSNWMVELAFPLLYAVLMLLVDCPSNCLNCDVNNQGNTVCLDQQCETCYRLKMSDGRCYSASLPDSLSLNTSSFVK